MTTRPDRTEAAEYYFTYIDQVPDGDIREILQAQLPETLALLRTVSEEQSLHRYAPGKWSIREVVGHLNDTERVFAFRAFWFARGCRTALPGFDQDITLAASGADQRSWASHIDEFQTVRAATLSLFRDLPISGWLERGIASENTVTVRALAYIAAGHVAHHVAILRKQYLQR